jgi:crotonobetainyl-CoA:carnitine CoA-transferase CaiB-like acyl-CoA transferase
MVSQGSREGPLRGTLVLDFSTLLPGPYAAFLLAQLGARVIKIESLSGDKMRTSDPGVYAVVNGGKENLAMDVKSPASVPVIDELLRRADVVLVSSLPGTLARLGLGADRVHGVNPAALYCHVLGWGGQMRDLPAHDLDVMAASGAVDLGPESAYPLALPAGDLATGNMAALAIVAGLAGDRQAGTVVEVSMAGVLESWVSVGSGLLSTEEEMPDRQPRFGGYGIFRGSDGRRFSIGAFEDRYWASLVHVVGLDAPLAGLSLTARRARASELNEQIESAVREQPAQEWVSRMQAASIPCALVASPREAPRSRNASGVVTVAPDGAVSVGFPAISLGRRLGPVAGLGEHTEAIVRWLGRQDDLAGLRSDAVIA